MLQIYWISRQNILFASHIYLRVKVDFFHRVMLSPEDAEGEGLQVCR